MRFMNLLVAQNAVLCLKQLSAFLFGAYFRATLCFVSGTAETPASHKNDAANGVNLENFFRCKRI